MDLQQLIRSRRSIRRFKTEPVPEDTLTRVLESATWAPSAHNRQPWRFVVLRSPEAKTRLMDAMEARFRADLTRDGLSTEEINTRINRSRTRIEGAPIAIVLCLDPGNLDSYPDPVRQRVEMQMGEQSVALAGGTLLLAAHAEGLGGVWICAPLFAPEAVQTSLLLPQTWQPQVLILLGYPAESPEPRLRKCLGEVVVYF
jgi:coenzyme F420-0:L-glutamate ligase / coenzyme F420-1:gamma-L-glutamate ligase